MYREILTDDGAAKQELMLAKNAPYNGARSRPKDARPHARACENRRATPNHRAARAPDQCDSRKPAHIWAVAPFTWAIPAVSRKDRVRPRAIRWGLSYLLASRRSSSAVWQLRDSGREHVRWCPHTWRHAPCRKPRALGPGSLLRDGLCSLCAPRTWCQQRLTTRCTT